MHCTHPSQSRSAAASIQHGFTAIELMVVVAIVAILAVLTAPSFTSLIERWRVRDAAENLTASFYLARSEAIKHGGSTIMKADTGTDWGSGWKVFFDANANGNQDACNTSVSPNECTLQAPSAPKNVGISLSGSTGALSFDRWGIPTHTGSTLSASNLTFELTPKSKTMSDPAALRLCISAGGRLIRKSGSDSC